MEQSELLRGEDIKNVETARIIEHLSRDKPEDDLILSLCQKHGLRWDEAHTLVDQVKEENAERIALRQMPLKTILAVCIGVGGFVLFLVSLLLLIDLVTLSHQIISFEGIDTRELFLLRFAGPDVIRYFTQVANAIPMVIFFLIQGLAMVIGSVIGMKEYWEILIDRVGKVLWK